MHTKITYMLFEIAFIAAIYIISKSIHKREISKVMQGVIYVIYAAYDISIYFSISDTGLITAFAIAGMVCLFYIFSGQFKKSIIYALFVVILGSISEMLPVFVVQFITGSTSEEIIHNPIAYIIVLGSARIVFLFFAMIFYYYEQKRGNQREIYRHWRMLVFIFVANLFIMAMLYTIIYSIEVLEILHIAAIIAVLIVMDIIIFVLYNEQDKYYKAKIEMENINGLMKLQKSFYQEEKYSFEQEKIERHDTKNYLLLLQDYVKKGDIESIEKSLDEKLKQNNQWLHVDSGDEILNIILQNKIKQAIRKNIKVIQEYGITEKINMKPEDLISLVGNGLDNAIEASEKCSNPTITIKIKNAKNRFEINIDNNFINEITVNESDNSILSSKAEKGHGYGIKSMESIVKKYDGIIDWKIQEDRFFLRVAMFNDADTSYTR